MKAVGIDLGTTNCAVAHLDEFRKPVVIPNRLGQPTTPSVICFEGGEVVIGEEAKELQRAGAPDVAAFFKRQMGDREFGFYAVGVEYSPTDLSALLLARLKEDAEAALGTPVEQAVITVPAYFRNPQRKATIAAGRQAGLEVLQVVNEPTAAAIAYGSQQRGAERLMLVYDLGGGTFDVTLLRVDEEEIRVLTSDGDQELGGKDWDGRIVEYLGGRFEREFGRDPFADAESVADLLVAAEDAKKRLSSVVRTTVSLTHGGDRGRYELSRDTLKELTGDLMERTISLTEKVLEGESLQAADLDGVLLVGGSTRMAMVHEYVRERLGHEPAAGVNVDEAVALGAAITAAQNLAEREDDGPRRLALPGIARTVDVTNHSLGMIAVNEDRSRYVNSIILPKNEVIPATLSRPFQHPVRGRSSDVEVYMTQGESDQPDSVTYLGRYVVRDVPPAAHGAQVLQIEYAYDVSGTVGVTARLKEEGTPLEVSVEPLPNDVPGRFLGPPAEVQPQHTTVYLAFDLSGSMSGRPLAEAKKAARTFLENVDLAHCSLGLCIFADRVRIVLPASQSAKQIKAAIDGLETGPVGYGNATDPFRELLEELRDMEGSRFLVTLADGVWYDQPAAVRRAKACHKEEIEVVAIGFGAADEAFLRQIASADEAGLMTEMGRLAETFGNIAQVITRSGGGITQSGAQRGGGSALSKMLDFLPGRDR